MPEIEPNEPGWYRDAIIYELHVRSFFDSDNDGMGDFNGLTAKLPYLQDLGVTAVWILPFYPSPWRDDGYDIANYTNVHEAYGTLRDFKRFLREAHRRGLRVITELVINHTSNQHPWFERARNAGAGSRWRNYYVWNDTPMKYEDARIIFKDFETSNWSWDPVAKQYYWHRFYSHQPDLNFDSEDVRREVFKVMDFWLDMGVDGLRLDAVPYLFEREDTNCENLPETHAYLKELRHHIEEKYSDRMLLAEANQWPEDAASYFGDGDECNMCFHFPIMPRLFIALKMEDRFPVVDILEQTPDVPQGCQWAIFLRNHDELTLEMVTDEERDYMYQVYARDPRHRINLGIRRRLAPLLENNRRRVELMNILLFSMPGSPILYYGDEIGMGDNVYLGDRDGVRTPMQWGFDKSAGFSQANPQKLYLPVIIDPEYHYEAVNVETQQTNPSSLLWWMKRVIGIRKNYAAFSRGEIKFLSSNNIHVLSFVRTYENETVLVLANLSRYVQLVDLDLSEYAGYVPEEIFSRNEFPRIKEGPYVLSIGGNDYYWFELQKVEELVAFSEAGRTPQVSMSARDWNGLTPRLQRDLERTVLPGYIRSMRWYRDKARKIKGTTVSDAIPAGSASDRIWIATITIQFSDDKSEAYLLPMAIAHGEYAEHVTEDFPQAVITRAEFDGEAAVVYDAVYSEELRDNVLSVILRRRTLKGKNGRLVGAAGRGARQVATALLENPGSRVLKAEQTNTSVLYRDSVFLKLYRKLEDGVNPELELLQYLTEKRKFAHVPRYIGTLEYALGKKTRSSVGLLVEFVRNEGDAYSFARDTVDRYFENVLAAQKNGLEPPKIFSSIFDVELSSIPEALVQNTDRFFLEMMSLLGRRIGGLHLALGAERALPEFKPEPFSLLYQRSIYQSMRSLVRRVMGYTKRAAKKDEAPALLRQVLEREADLLKQLARVRERKLNSQKTRIHGDLHLGQVLFSGRDFTIIDFEGEPARTLGERRLKYCPLRDVAGMIRSFHYAVYSTFLEYSQTRTSDIASLQPWVSLWYTVVSGVFLRSYLDTVAETPLLPKSEDDVALLLNVFLLEKAVYELGYELNNRPDWVSIPCDGVLRILEETEGG